MRLFEISTKLVPCPYNNSVIKTPLYHGTTGKFAKFNRVPHGVFFTPHISHAEVTYGKDLVICYVNILKLYTLDYDTPGDDEIVDALFDRDYESVAKTIITLSNQGYSAMQTQTDSEMICVFNGTDICSALTGKAM
jgi:hypothetical protein